MNGTATPLRTDTVRMPRIDVDPDTTVEFSPPWLMPPVTRRVDRTPVTVRWCRRLATSEYATHLHAGWQRALAVMGVFGIAYFVLLIARGAWVASQLLGTAALIAVAVVLGGGLLIGRLMRRIDEATTLPAPEQHGTRTWVA